MIDLKTGSRYEAIRICFLVALALLTLPAASASAQSVANRIAFTSLRSGFNEIYLLDDAVPGSRPTLLARGASPAWSPDGQSIAYEAGTNTQTQIYVIKADGTNPVQLTKAATRATGPAWSPDGKHIAYTSFDDGRDEVYVMNADGSAPTRLTTGYGNSPAWSPDGKRIAYISAGEIHLIDVDGSNSFRLTNNHFTINSAETSDFAWSPDGQAIAFTLFIDEHDAIFRVNADGSQVTRLTQIGDLNARFPSWSPDGTRIVYSVYTTLNQDLFVMNADGSNPTRITNGFEAYQPAWAPR